MQKYFGKNIGNHRSFRILQGTSVNQVRSATISRIEGISWNGNLEKTIEESMDVMGREGGVSPRLESKWIWEISNFFLFFSLFFFSFFFFSFSLLRPFVVIRIVAPVFLFSPVSSSIHPRFLIFIACALNFPDKTAWRGSKALLESVCFVWRGGVSGLEVDRRASCWQDAHESLDGCLERRIDDDSLTKRFSIDPPRENHEGSRVGRKFFFDVESWGENLYGKEE